MRIETKEIKLFTFEEASQELRDKIRENFHLSYYYGEFMLQERIETLKALSDYINGKLDYSISLVPDRGEFIKITDYDERLLNELCNNDKDCPLTGVYYDDDIIQDIKENDLKCALSKYLDRIHDEYEWMLTDEYLLDLCEANEYEFTENGEIY